MEQDITDTMEEVGMAKKNTRKKKNKQNFGLLEDDDEDAQ